MFEVGKELHKIYHDYPLAPDTIAVKKNGSQNIKQKITA